MRSRAYTTTVNPLQFEALEPRRFEDLVRQLLYGFRPWRSLEATGRLGADDGFDIRGWECLEGTVDDVGEIEAPGSDRVWLVQCKRERSIGPTKLMRYLEGIGSAQHESLNGLIFVACADFSKRSRDEFRQWCAAAGIQEFHLWGKAELEDQLFQPHNDSLLFAYFGLSLTIRRRSEQARLRAQTTIKRKLERALDGKQDVLIRDAADDQYPYTGDKDDGFRWWVCPRPRITFRGLECLTRRYFALTLPPGVPSV
jgi:hypothetical protein